MLHEVHNAPASHKERDHQWGVFPICILLHRSGIFFLMRCWKQWLACLLHNAKILQKYREPWMWFPLSNSWQRLQIMSNDTAGGCRKKKQGDSKKSTHCTLHACYHMQAATTANTQLHAHVSRHKQSIQKTKECQLIRLLSHINFFFLFTWALRGKPAAFKPLACIPQWNIFAQTMETIEIFKWAIALCIQN